MGPLSALVFFYMVVLLEAGDCPAEEDMLPCECYISNGANFMTCKNLRSPEDLVSPMKAIAKSKTILLTLTIDNSSLQYLPDGIFQNTHVEWVLFDNTEIVSLSKSDSAFKGLEETLNGFRAIDAKFVSHWDFDQLRNLRKLSFIDVNQMILGTVDHPLPHLPKLQSLTIVNAEISFVADSAFSNLPKLSLLNINRNSIPEIKRNMFPNPARSLYLIDLSQNKLSSLPEDFFENMPALTFVHLDKNRFTTLAEKPFSNVMKSLEILTMTENPFRCDCRMRWLANIKIPRHFDGECSSPESLSGRKFDRLEFKSLLCY